MRLLVAEDHDDTREMLGMALQQHGWDVFVAKDGRDALRIYHDAIEKGEYFDALLLDVAMPRLNGFAVGVSVRHVEKFGNIPRAVHIYLTGYDDAVPPDQLLESEVLGSAFVDAYIHKPISAEELIDQIEKLVKKD